MPTRLSREQRIQAEIRKLSKRQLGRLRQVTEALDDSGAFDEIQKVFEESNRLIRGETEKKREQMLKALLGSLRINLSERGAGPDSIRDIERLVLRNWMRVIVGNEPVDIRGVLTGAIAEWDSALSEETRRVDGRKHALGWTRVILGGGGIVFDSVKFLVISPVPQFLFSSYIAGVMVFLKGLDQLFLDK